MKHILLIFAALVLEGSMGCAASTETLIAEAEECVAHAPGIVGQPSDEQRKACWADVNKRLDVEAERDAKRLAEEANRCPKGMVRLCQHWDCQGRNAKSSGQCISSRELDRILRDGRW